MNTIERFVSFVNPTSGCWNWTGGKTSRGYGNFWLNGKTVAAHRFSYEQHHGEIPDGMFVCHSCDNPSCVNPEHLFLGTPADNTADMVAKGRKVIGPPGKRAKLTEVDVSEIRHLVSSGMTQRAVAKDYGVDPSTVSYIITNKTWKG